MLLFFSGFFFFFFFFYIFGRRAVGVFVKDDCCFPYLLITKSTYICTTWSSIKDFRHVWRCKREPPSVTKWTCYGNCISRCLDSFYMLSENSPLINSQLLTEQEQGAKVAKHWRKRPRRAARSRFCLDLAHLNAEVILVVTV